MNRVSNLLAWGATAIAAALAALNWSTLMEPAPLNLVFMEVHAPLGVVMLGLAAGLVALFFVAYLRSQISSLLENRRLLKEIQRAHELADQADASRIENLHQLIATEFRLLNDRLNRFPETKEPSSLAAGSENRRREDGSPLSLTELMTRGEQS